MSGKRRIRFVIFSILALGLISGVAYYVGSKNPVNMNQPKSQNQNIQKSQETPKPQSAKLGYYYPIANYVENLTFRWYGKKVTSAEQAEPCGAKFNGYHTGDDIEATDSDKNLRIPVYAISDSTIINSSAISGYGGLLVLSGKIKGQDYTIYYGHLNLDSVQKKVGQKVKAGEKVAELGEACSIETSGERKHLHFAIRRGTKIDVRGYVLNLTQLTDWVNPKDFLSSVKADTVD